ncbi:MAG: glycoside hydrolase family 97 N-terminal domain-containing protein, partial [Tidjanibacter sp.]|nr:glycoside hydrolase family 97 N-terminal domain-containing protein [Tidjanibacter sp.]
MRNRRFLATVLLAVLCISASAKELHLGLASPNGKLEVGITVGHKHTTWSLSVDGREIMAPSRLALTLCDGTTLGLKAKPRKVKKGSVEGTIEAPLYRQATIEERYNWLTVQMQGGYSVEFRAYNDGVAYRFVTNLKTPQVDVADELVEFRFAEDYPIVIPYTSGYHRTPYTSSFESQYTFGRLSQVSDATEYGFTPLLIDVGESGRVLIMESDVESYPGLFVEALGEGYGLRGVLTPLPTEMKTTESGSFYPGGYQQGIIASTV